MRWLLPILLLLAVPCAVSQALLKDNDGNVITFEAPDGSLVAIKAPPEGISVDELMESLRKQGITPVGTRCHADYSDIEAEQKESDAHLRAMRDKVIPLKHQYEQELYYRDRREKLFQKKCGKPFKRARTIDDPSSGREDMTKKACEAIGVVCKPVKHW